MAFTKEQILEIERKLAELPEFEKTENLNKLDALKLMQSTIHNLKTRGYSNNMIADYLSTNGFDITPQLLTSYLALLKKKSGKRVKKPATARVQKQVAKDSVLMGNRIQDNSKNIEIIEPKPKTDPVKPATINQHGNFTSLIDTEKL